MKISAMDMDTIAAVRAAMFEGDGPKIELLPGVTEPYEDADTRTRTVSMRAIGATFHHAKGCPCGGGYR